MSTSTRATGRRSASTTPRAARGLARRTVSRMNASCSPVPSALLTPPT
ncbi:hypothetical protein [Kitasatospora sp. NA04385]|nr:hypothetical protein [Kitasatospora sp. NA04385]